ncbi:hypothetical protein BGX38DRAFT_560238 [Terfezia claveryi]|nr:hypothetical protein BGX38DRAFT_560238 [Terfezia claveryi]
MIDLSPPPRPPRLKRQLGLLALLTLGTSLFIIEFLTPRGLLHPAIPEQSTAKCEKKTFTGDSGTCIPLLPPYITRTPLTSLPPSFLTHLHTAKARLRNKLDAYAATSNDTIAISVIHSHSPSSSSSSSSAAFSLSKGAAAGEELFWWGKGRVKLNTTTQEDSTLVTRSSIFRIASITKVFTVLQGLLLQDRSSLRNGSEGQSPRLSMSDPIHLHLPDFTLPLPFTNELITLDMLGGHTSGLARDISVSRVTFSDDSGTVVLEYMPWKNLYHYKYPQGQGNPKVLSFDFDTMEKEYMGRGGSGNGGDGMARISVPGKCRHMREGDENNEWHMCTKEELFRLVK